MSEAFYSITSPEPTTPEGIYAKALAEALQSDPEITKAFAKAVVVGDEVGVLDAEVEASLPKTNAGKAAKAKLATLRGLYAAVEQPAPADGGETPADGSAPEEPAPEADPA